MENMNAQSTVWKIQVQESHSRLRTIPGDALLAAAAVIYHGCLDDVTRQELMQDWQQHCEVNSFDGESLQAAQTRRVTLTRPTHAASQAPDSRSDFNADTQSELSSLGESFSALSSTVSAGSRIPIALNLKAMPGKQTLDNSNKKELLMTRENFSLQNVLSSFDELSDWKLKAVPDDVYSIHNALIMRTNCHVNPHCWPLLVDPDDQAELWIKTLQASNNCIYPEDLQQCELTTSVL